MGMKDILKVTFALLGFFTSLSSSQKPVYYCLGETTCQFVGVVLNTTHYEWQPAADYPNTVLHVSFGSSIIPIFTKGICELFPILEQLYLQDLEIVEVKEDAFHACSALTHLFLHRNRVKRLYPNTFLYTRNLILIFLEQNEIEHLEGDHLFANMPKLALLSLYDNNLTNFSPDLIRNCESLGSLYLQSNDLSDLDVVQIVENLPSLEGIQLDDNEISCVRLVEILSFFEAKGISGGITKEGSKTRYYPQQSVFGGYKCNPDISWMASEHRKDNTKADQRLHEIEKNSMRNFEEITKLLTNNQEMHKKMNEIDQRLDQMDDKLEILVKLMSTLKK